MITNFKTAKDILFNPNNRLAIIVGNGINRFAYGNELDTSWSKLLLNTWRRTSPITLSTIDKGITFTEFYDIMEFESSPKAVLDNIVNIVSKWDPKDYHFKFQSKFKELNLPVLTTNFDRNIEGGLRKAILYKDKDDKSFTDYYPWNIVYTDNKDFSIANLHKFGIWHINGTIDYPRSLRLSLSQYTNQAKRASEFIHNRNNIFDDFKGKNQEYWKGYNTWLHLIFNCDLCILGLGLDEQETFLRWLLIERSKYFRKYPDRKKDGWYVCTKKDLTSSKSFFLEKIGFEIIQLKNFGEVYERLFDIK